MPLLEEALQALGAKTKRAPTREGEERTVLRARVGGLDRRRAVYKGWLELEPFAFRGVEGAFCLMLRDKVCCAPRAVVAFMLLIVCAAQGNPISWRVLWKALIQSPEVEPHVWMRKDFK